MILKTEHGSPFPQIIGLIKGNVIFMPFKSPKITCLRGNQEDVLGTAAINTRASSPI